MAILIVGADNLGNIEKNLEQFDITEVVHVTGRNTINRKSCKLSSAITLVLILTDFVNHNTAEAYKKEAKVAGIPLAFAKRSWCSIKGKILEKGF
ncbi:MAG: hypothetical protein K0Q53_1413 [Massilibacillus sp.]|jgi:hypothetical protein|nr:hypothetical protein [Massilibacillus sp.]